MQPRTPPNPQRHLPTLADVGHSWDDLNRLGQRSLSATLTNGTIVHTQPVPTPAQMPIAFAPPPPKPPNPDAFPPDNLKMQPYITLRNHSVGQIEKSLRPALIAADSIIEILRVRTLADDALESLITLLQPPNHKVKEIVFEEDFFYSMSPAQIEAFFKIAQLTTIGFQGSHETNVQPNPASLLMLEKLTQQKNITRLVLSRVSPHLAAAALKLLTHPDNNITTLDLYYLSIKTTFALTPLFQRGSNVNHLGLRYDTSSLAAWRTLCLALRDQQNTIQQITLPKTAGYLPWQTILADLNAAQPEKNWYAGEDFALVSKDFAVLARLSPAMRNSYLVTALKAQHPLSLKEPSVTFIELIGPTLFSQNSSIRTVGLNNPSDAAVEALLLVILSDPPSNISRLYIKNITLTAMEKLVIWLFHPNSRLYKLALAENLPSAVIELIGLALKHHESKITHIKFKVLPKLLALPFLDTIAHDQCNIKSISLEGTHLESDSLDIFFDTLAAHPYFKIEQLKLMNIAKLNSTVREIKPRDRNNLNYIDKLQFENISKEAISDLIPLLFSQQMNPSHIALSSLDAATTKVLCQPLLDHLSKPGKKTITLKNAAPEAARLLFATLKHKKATLILKNLKAESIDAILDEAKNTLIQRITIDWQKIAKDLTPEQKQGFEKLSRSTTIDFEAQLKNFLIFQEGKRLRENDTEETNGNPTKKPRIETPGK